MTVVDGSLCDKYEFEVRGRWCFWRFLADLFWFLDRWGEFFYNEPNEYFGGIPMKNSKLLLALVLALALVVGVILPTQAQAEGDVTEEDGDISVTLPDGSSPDEDYLAKGACGSSVTWTLDTDGILTVSGTGAMADYDYNGTDTSPWKNYKSSITTVIVQDGVTCVGEYAFAGCQNLTTLIIGNDVNTIGNWAFSQCYNLSEVKFGTGLIHVGAYAFYQCYMLETLAFNSRIASVEHNAFEECYRITSVEFTQGVVAVYEDAFYGCWGITYLALGDCLTSLYEGAFNAASLDYLVLPGTLQRMEADALGDVGHILFTGTQEQWDALEVDTYNSDLSGVQVDVEAAGDEIITKTVCRKTGLYCLRCDAFLDGGKPSHVYGSYVSNNDATCTKNGTKTAKCNYCDQTKTREEYNSKLSHSFTNYISNGDTTCTELGTETAKCDRCTATDTREFSGDLSGIHQYGDWYVTTPAGPNTAGNQRRNCINCDHYEDMTLAPLTPDGWMQENGRWYFLKNGARQVGWLLDGGKWYYLDADGMMQTDWLQVGGVWYYFNSSGAMVTGWLQQGGIWYYLKSSGAMVTGWLQQGGIWYYLKSSGAMATGWLQLGNTWYYLNTSGAMVTGWQRIGNAWYYFHSSGAMATGWLQQGSTWYYLHSSGAMATGTVTIGTTTYRFHSSGAWIP